jgi:transcriptional regulator with XRE-family HTH domain
MPVHHTPRLSRHSPRFPNAIREYRLKAGLTQRKLGELLGRTRDAVSAWERGLALPKVPILFRMAKLLNTLTESLYFDLYSTYRKDHDNAATT